MAVDPERSACKGMDPNLFFPDRGAYQKSFLPKKVCAGCSERRECLQGAIDRHEQFGIWGGLSLEERRRYMAKYGHTVTVLPPVVTTYTPRGPDTRGLGTVIEAAMGRAS